MILVSFENVAPGICFINFKNSLSHLPCQWRQVTVVLKAVLVVSITRIWCLITLIKPFDKFTEFAYITKKRFSHNLTCVSVEVTAAVSGFSGHSVQIW